ncbi:MAG: ferritin-like domain-containing protein [Ilumatobacteraceae bacterium]
MRTTAPMTDESIKALAEGPFSRRRLLAGAGFIGAALVAAACGSDDKDTATTTAPTTGATTATTAGTTAETTAETAAPATTTGETAAPATTTGDTQAPETSAAPDDGAATDGKIATLAAGLEVLAVNTYGAALKAAGSGALGDVPPAVGEFVTTAMAQHQEQLDKWNEVLKAAGAPEVTKPNAELEPVVAEAFGKVTDIAGAAKLALLLEQIAAATYQSAIPVISDPDARVLAGSIQIIDFQHAAILLFVLGEYPVPDTFGPLDKAVAA